MKTKIYLLLICICFFICSSITHARWYGNTVRAVNNGNCPENDGWRDVIGPVDGDLGGVLPGDAGWPYFQTASSVTSYQARVTGGSVGALNCDQWDSTFPDAQYTNNSLTWSKDPITATLTSSDNGGSGLTPASQRYILDAPAASCLPFGTPYSSPTNFTINTDGDHTLYVCVTDIAGNSYTSAGGTYRVDQQPPTGTISYVNGWRNFSNGHIITISVADQAGLSGIDNYTVEVAEAIDSPSFAVWGPYNPVAGCIGMTSGNCTVNGLQNHHAYRYRVRIRDVATNETLVTGTDILKIDLTPPTLADVSNPNVLNYLAGTQAYNVTVSNALGSPITVIQANSEDSTNELTNTFRSSASSSLAFAWVTENTDNTINLISGGREYTFNLTRIEDEAGNIWSGVDPKIHTIYANPNFGLNNTPDTTAFAPILVADGTQYTWQNWLQDGYGNDIVPAPGIGRTITQSLESLTNSMYLDQFTRLGATSVYIFTGALLESPLMLSVAPTSQSLGILDSTDGRYPIYIKTYTPTFDGTSGVPISDINAGFGFNTRFIISDSLIGPSQVVNTAGPDFRFSPLFTTDITGDLHNGGFIEGTEQISSIQITKTSGTSTSNENLNVTFSGIQSLLFNFYASIGSPPAGASIGSSLRLHSSATLANVGYVTQLVQIPGPPVDNLSNLYTSTHISYEIDGKPVIINSDIIGKASFHDLGPTPLAGNQVGIKILGSIGGKNVDAIITDQFSTGVSIFKGADRSLIRQEIKKNIALATRNAIFSPVGSSVSDLSILPGGATAQGVLIGQPGDKSIMLIEKNGGNVILDITSPVVSKISGIRTLVVRGANLFIKSDMYYDPLNPSMLGIVLEKDINGNGGNLYIDPNVTNVVGTYIIDGSVMSYDSVKGILGSTGTIADLKNQLHIYGTIVSENTIGGSRQNPPKCPNLLNVVCTNVADSQKYDLNYLRRYYITALGEPFGGAKVIGGGTCPLGACTPGNPNLAHKFSDMTNEFSKYPIIIEFNPKIQSVIPIGFDKIYQD